MQRKRNSRRKLAEPLLWPSLPKLPILPWRRILDSVLLLSLLTAVYGGTLWLLDRPISTIKIEAPFERVMAVQVEAAITPFIHHGFLAADLPRIQAAIADLPWVERVAVRRSWPATLHVAITEERAAARWGEGGLLNVYGELFVTDTSHIPAELPALNGPEGSEREVAQRFFSLQKELQQRGLHAVSLSYDRRGSWHLGISNGMQVRFGTTDIDHRTGRFFKAMDQVLAGMADRVNYIDMRYTNGFAVGWKPSTAMKLAETGASTSNAW